MGFIGSCCLLSKLASITIDGRLCKRLGLEVLDDGRMVFCQDVHS
jgi:hypothetical protein